MSLRAAILSLAFFPTFAHSATLFTSVSAGGGGDSSFYDFSDPSTAYGDLDDAASLGNNGDGYAVSAGTYARAALGSIGVYAASTASIGTDSSPGENGLIAQARAEFSDELISSVISGFFRGC